MKKEMKAAHINHFGGIENIEIGYLPVPKPQDHEVLIEISHAGINPVDWKVAEGLLKTRMEFQFPIILGWDASGTVSQVGKDVKNLKEGDPVFAYCRKEVLHDGSFAEYICLNADYVVKKPKNLSFAEAASVPLSTLTAWQAIFDTAHLKPQEDILIHAGAGGVGSYAIQLAKIAKAHVITTASTPNFEYVKTLGADEVIDYTQASFLDHLLKTYPKGVDVVFDTVGGATLKLSYKAVKEEGRLITIAGIIDQALAAQTHLFAEFVFVAPNGEELQQIANLIEEEKIKAPHIQEIPFEEVASALRKSREGHTQGKLVLKIK